MRRFLRFKTPLMKPCSFLFVAGKLSLVLHIGPRGALQGEPFLKSISLPLQGRRERLRDGTSGQRRRLELQGNPRRFLQQTAGGWPAT